jgi:RNA polymerase sigma-70 factor (ECF subfamily)
VQSIFETEPQAVNIPATESLPTRNSLLSRMKDLGDEVSWRDFFETYWELIYNLARKAGLTDVEAQDVVQDTVIAVSRNIGGFQTGAQYGSFKAWLLQQARWRIADQFRKREKFARFDRPTNPEPQHTNAHDDQTATATVNRIPDPASIDTDAAWDTEWEKHLLKLALERVKAKVSVKRFQMFDLHALQGLTAKESARAVGASVMAVHMATSRVRRLLRKEVARLSQGEPGIDVP